MSLSDRPSSAVLWQVVLAVAWFAAPGLAAEWSTTELHYQHGRLAAPAFAGGGSAPTHILTPQHASGWGWGDVFFFADLIDDARLDGFDDRDLYAEIYLCLSLGKLRGGPFELGPVRDLGLVGGVNWSRDAKVLKYLPGVRASFDVPGMAFLNLDLTAYLDDSSGLSGGGAPAESDSFMVDLSWAAPFALGGQRFSVEGHVEYIGRRSDELGHTVHPWVLAQPQLRWDLGHALRWQADHLFVGVEWQLWINKLGDAGTDENAVQALAVWRF